MRCFTFAPKTARNLNVPSIKDVHGSCANVAKPMGGKFVMKPSESMVEEVEQWFGFLPTDPIRTERDVLHHFIDGALNIVRYACLFHWVYLTL